MWIGIGSFSTLYGTGSLAAVDVIEESFAISSLDSAWAVSLVPELVDGAGGDDIDRDLISFSSGVAEVKRGLDLEGRGLISLVGVGDGDEGVEGTREGGGDSAACQEVGDLNMNFS